VTSAGADRFPRAYDTLLVEVLDDVADRDGEAAVDALLARQAQRAADEYTEAVTAGDGLAEKVHRLAGLRDAAGYLAAARTAEDGTFVLTECNCAVERVAARFPTMCALELEIIRQVIGPEATVERTAHALAGDGMCAYRISPCVTNRAAATPAAPA
jgi:predicted ArsR family transcriptional regulator